MYEALTEEMQLGLGELLSKSSSEVRGWRVEPATLAALRHGMGETAQAMTAQADPAQRAALRTLYEGQESLVQFLESLGQEAANCF